MHSYRRLDAWKHAHAALRLTLRATDDAYHGKSRALFDQLKRAAISVEANIVEGYALAAGEAGYLEQSIVKRLEDMFGGAMRTLRPLLLKPPNAG